jgi:hypothetical protein
MKVANLLPGNSPDTTRPVGNGVSWVPTSDDRPRFKGATRRLIIPSPTGRIRLSACPGNKLPGYYHQVPPGQSGPTIKLTLIRGRRTMADKTARWAVLVLEGAGNRIAPSPVYIGKRLLMKLLSPINCTTKTTTKSNHLLHSALASGFLALAACSTLAPNTNQPANYFDERPAATSQKTNNPEPAYSWFY